jgi:hypothetical protein
VIQWHRQLGAEGACTPSNEGECDFDCGDNSCRFQGASQRTGGKYAEFSPSITPSKLGHTRRDGAHFEDLDEAHPCIVLQEAISLLLISNIKKTAFLPCQNSVRMSSASQHMPFALHESPRPLIQYVGPNQLEQNTSTIKTNALYAQ